MASPWLPHLSSSPLTHRPSTYVRSSSMSHSPLLFLTFPEERSRPTTLQAPVPGSWRSHGPPESPAQPVPQRAPTSPSLAGSAPLFLAHSRTDSPASQRAPTSPSLPGSAPLFLAHS